MARIKAENLPADARAEEQLPDWGLKKQGLDYQDRNAIVAALRAGQEWDEVKATLGRGIAEPVLEGWKKHLIAEAEAPVGPVLPQK